MKSLLTFLSGIALLFAGFNLNEPFEIHGTVTDTSGQPVVAATVQEKGSSKAAITDSKGAFTLRVSSNRAVLMVSAVGYEAKQVKVAGKKEHFIQLHPATNKLEEVVVTGYESLLSSEPKALVGRVAGVNVARDRSAKRNAPVNPQPSEEEFNTEDYDGITENRFLTSTQNPLSTFSIDVDAASYSNVRRFLNQGQLPPAGAVRIEEMINYFPYSYPQPNNDDAFSIYTEMAACPWNTSHQLVLIGLHGKKIPFGNLPPSNLVFLIDVSGSMQDPNKLPLVKSSLQLLVNQLRENDRVSMVVYAGSAGVVLNGARGDQKSVIRDAINRLEAGGSTAGGAGIRLAYKTAREQFIRGGNNRVILCTDGDFNVGVSSDAELEQIISEEKNSGVFLTVLGYGMGNYKDNKMQKLADKGNGNHAYIDSEKEAKKVLVKEFGGTLFTIAKDVKLQIEFNPQLVQAYRLIGYENRLLNKEDFNNDKKDAGELGSGHTVTALYEIIPVGVENEFEEPVDPLKYVKPVKKNLSRNSAEWMTIKFRYKQPDGDISRLIEHPVRLGNTDIRKTSDDFRLAAAVAQFGMILRHSEFRQQSSFGNILDLVKNNTGNDPEGLRSEFVMLVKKARSMGRAD